MTFLPRFQDGIRLVMLLYTETSFKVEKRQWVNTRGRAPIKRAGHCLGKAGRAALLFCTREGTERGHVLGTSGHDRR